MMHDMMMGGSMWGMGLIGLLVFLVLILGLAALINTCSFDDTAAQ